MQVINEFFEGLDTDTSVFKIKNTKSIKLSGFRLITTDGQGYVLSNLKGNELSYSLTAGFVPLGKTEFNGIAYIVSHNPSSGVGEIGCYPAPNALATENCAAPAGFTHAYAPLFNFTGGSSARDPLSANLPFRTSAFEFADEDPLAPGTYPVKNQIEMFARLEYDESVNLYITNNKNPFRVINTGFNQVGECTDPKRRYDDNSFPNFVNLFHESAKHLSADFDGQNDTGKLRAGHWHFFFRYKTINFDATSFNSEIGPIAVTRGKIINPGYLGEGQTHHGAPGDTVTDKSIKMTLTDMDPAYEYVEVAYMYSKDGTQEFGIIDKLYSIEESLTPSALEIEITGHESVANITFDELIKKKPSADTGKTHTQLENRWFGANVREGSPLDDELAEALRLVTSRIVPSYDDSETQSHLTGVPLGPATISPELNKFIYNDEENIFKYTGYFRGESYPFGAVYVLDNGIHTPAFPVEGLDDYGSGIPSVTNVNGVYRFPNIIVSNTFDSATNDVHIMGITFDATNATIEFNNLSADLKSRVKGMYLVRGERNPNLIYQGFTLPVYSSELMNQCMCMNLNPRCAPSPPAPFPVSNINDAALLLLGGKGLNDCTSGVFDEHSPKRAITYNDAAPAPGPFDPPPILVRSNDLVFPMVESVFPVLNVWSAYLPYIYSGDRSIPTGGAGSRPVSFPFSRRDWAGRVDVEKIGFYSSDHHFLKELNLKTAHIVSFGQHPINPLNIKFNNEYCKRDFFQDFSLASGLSYLGAPNVFPGAVISNVAEWEQASNNKFTSFFTEGAEDEFGSLMFTETIDGFATNYPSRANSVASSEIAFSTYIGITHDSISSADGYHYMNIYTTDPGSGSYNIVDLYDVKSTKYYKISDYIPIDSNDDGTADFDVVINPSKYYKGDCFLQRVFRKQLYNPKYAPRNEGDIQGLTSGLPPYVPAEVGPSTMFVGNTQPTFLAPLTITPVEPRNNSSFQFGMTIAFITENNINNAMRHDNFTNKFFPGDNDMGSFSLNNVEKEADDYNQGYNQILSLVSFPGFDEEIPFRDVNNPERVMYSQKHETGAFLDGYRDVLVLDYQDYDFRMGGITKLHNFNGVLISVQEEGINRHYVNERSTLEGQPGTSGLVTIGTGDILGTKHDNLTDFAGSQHQWSIIDTENFLWGIDFNKRKIWRVPRAVNTVEMVSDTKTFRKEITEMCEAVNSHSDIVHALEFPDNPIGDGGISVGFDVKHREIIWSFIYPDSLGVPNRSITFNEWADYFSGDRNYKSPFYVSINEDFISHNPNSLVDGYIHDENSDYGVYYGSVDAEVSYVEFVVNMPSSDIPKVYDWLKVNSGPESLLKVIYNTQHQEAAHDPFLQPALSYLNPKYNENAWDFPIIRATVITEPTNNIYSVGSRMRGRYLKIRLEYQSKNSTFIKSVITSLRESKN